MYERRFYAPWYVQSNTCRLEAVMGLCARPFMNTGCSRAVLALVLLFVCVCLFACPSVRLLLRSLQVSLLKRAKASIAFEFEPPVLRPEAFLAVRRSVQQLLLL